jgi:hypothetical protein
MMGHAMGGSSAPVQKNGKSIRPAPSSLCGGVPLSLVLSRSLASGGLFLLQPVEALVAAQGRFIRVSRRRLAHACPLAPMRRRCLLASSSCLFHYTTNVLFLKLLSPATRNCYLQKCQSSRALVAARANLSLIAFHHPLKSPTRPLAAVCM